MSRIESKPTLALEEFESRQDSADAALRRYAEILERIHDAIIETDLTGMVRQWNRGAEQTYGYTAAEAIGRHISFLYLPDELHLLQQHVLDPLWEKGHHEVELRVRRKSGEIRTVQKRLLLLRDNSGQPEAMIGFSQDITERKRAEEALLASENRLRAIIETEPECVKVVAPNGTLLDMNPAGLAMLDAESLEVAQRQPLLHYLLPEYRQAFGALHQRVMRGESGMLEFEVSSLRGVRRWLETHAVPLRNDQGAITALLGITRDVTERKLAEDRIRESESRFRIFVDHATDAFFLFGDDGIVLDVNTQACESLGYSREELIGLTPFAFDPDITPERMDHLRGTLEAEELVTFESRHRRKDGSLFPVEVRTRPFSAGGRLYSLSLARDITKRKQAEEGLRKSEELYRRLVEGVRLIAWEFDPTSKQFLFVSRHAEEILGYSIQAWHEPGFWFDHLHPEDRDRAVTFSRGNVARGIDHEHEYRMLRPDGTTVWFKDITTVVQQDGKAVRLRGVFIDITERNRAQEALRNSVDLQRLTLSELDHRVRNNLASLSALIDISARDKSDVKEFAASIKDRLQAMSTVHSLLSRGHWMAVSLKSVIESLTPTDMRASVVTQGPDVMITPRQVTALGMVIQELVANSLKYGSLQARSGRVEIHWTMQDSTDAETRALELNWREIGGPPIEQAPQPGQGTGLIQGFVNSELRGCAELSYPRTGAIHRLMLKLDRAT